MSVMPNESESLEPELSEVERIRKQLVELMSSMSDLKDLIKPYQEEQQSIRLEISDYRKRIESLNTQYSKIENHLTDTRNKMRTADFDIKRLERELSLAETAAQLRNQLINLNKNFDDIIAGAPWREFALNHQITGAKTLAAAKRGLLADKVGLGKSLTSLIWLDLLKFKRVVCIVPKDTASNFIREIRHWAPHRMVLDLTSKPKAERNFATSMLMMQQDLAFVLVVNYEAWRRDNSLKESIISIKADAFILDEAHRIKNRSTSAARGVREMVLAENICVNSQNEPPCRGSLIANPNVSSHERLICSVCNTPTSSEYRSYLPVEERPHATKSVKGVLCMTGTPILNKPQDLYPMLNLIDPQQFPDEYSFLSQFCIRNYATQRWMFSSGGLESITKKLKERYVSRDRKAAGITIPPQEIQFYNLEFDAEAYPNQAKVMKDLNTRAMIMMEEDKVLTMFNMLEIILRKRQAALYPDAIAFRDPDTNEVLYRVDCNESIKLDFILNKDGEGLLDELTASGNMQEGERVVIFSQFKTALKELERRIKEYAPNISVARYDGDTPDHIAEEIKIDLNKMFAYENGRKPKWQVVLANYKKGGVGLNFTDATEMIILDEEWSPGNNEQAYGRIDRMGQTKETTVHIIQLANSIDSWLRSLIEEKASMIGGFESNMELQQALRNAITEGLL